MFLWPIEYIISLRIISYILSYVTLYDLIVFPLPLSNNSSSFLIHITFKLNFVFPGFLTQLLLGTTFSSVIVFSLSLSVSVINSVIPSLYSVLEITLAFPVRLSDVCFLFSFYLLFSFIHLPSLCDIYSSSTWTSEW